MIGFGVLRFFWPRAHPRWVAIHRDWSNCGYRYEWVGLRILHSALINLDAIWP